MSSTKTSDIEKWIKARIGRVVGGKYLIKRSLGYGGYGVAFLAENKALLDMEVVVKVLQAKVLESESESGRKRFEREIKVLAKFQHVSIVSILDVGSDNGYPFYVMDYMRGETLAQRFVAIDKADLSIEDRALKAVEWLGPIADALDFLHSRTEKIVHRDVKPSNILFDPNGYPHLGDFGLVKSLVQDNENSEPLTRGIGVGTLEYAACEQINGFPCVQSDQFSLAMIIFELLTGVGPFGKVGKTASQELAYYKRLGEGQPELAHKINSKIPGAASRVIDQALQHEPLKRFDSCTKFMSAFKAAWPDKSKIKVARPTPFRPESGSSKTQQLCPHCQTPYFFDESDPNKTVSCMVCSHQIDSTLNKIISPDETPQELPFGKNVTPEDIVMPAEEQNDKQSPAAKEPEQKYDVHQKMKPDLETAQKVLKDTVDYSGKTAGWLMPILYAVAIPRVARAHIAGPMRKKDFEIDDQHPERRGHDEPAIADHVNIVFLRWVFWVVLLVILLMIIF